MIVSNVDWKEYCKVNPDINILISELEKTICDIDCKNLSYSGGIDSTIILYIMHKLFGKSIRTFTIAKSYDHPDYIAGRKITSMLDVEWNGLIIDQDNEYDIDGNYIVKQFYKKLVDFGITSIVACDGIDEYMGGYYDHMHNPSLETYYHYLSELVDKHLTPLDKNSGNISVYLPYLSPNLVTLYNNYEFSFRFDKNSRKKLIFAIAKKMGIPNDVIDRRKYGFCDANKIKCGELRKR